MASDRHRRLARLERRLADEQCPWVYGRGLASLLTWDKASCMSDEPDDDESDYAHCAGTPGLRGLLFYQAPYISAV
jgi:hypothetical protein